MKKTKKQKETPTNYKGIFLFILIITAVFFYWNSTKNSTEETYKIKSAGGEGGYRASFINTTGKDTEEKKIKLSDDYWTGGKFGF